MMIGGVIEPCLLCPFSGRDYKTSEIGGQYSQQNCVFLPLIVRSSKRRLQYRNVLETVSCSTPTCPNFFVATGNWSWCRTGCWQFLLNIFLYCTRRLEKHVINGTKNKYVFGENCRCRLTTPNQRNIVNIFCTHNILGYHNQLVPKTFAELEE